MTTAKKTVLLRAPLLTQSGYGVHSRQVARWLFEVADNHPNLEVVTEPLPWGQTPWIVDTDAHDGLIGRCIQSAKKLDKYDVSIQLQLPNEWNPMLADFNVGMTAAVETDRCNPSWVEAVNRMDLVIVPSEFVKQVFLNSGTVKTRIEVVPEAFIDTVLTDELPSLDLELPTKTNFLVFSQFTGNNPENDRKNIFYTVKWFAETFETNPDVGLVIKTNMARNTVVDKMQTVNLLGQLTTETRKGPFPAIHLLHGDMSDKEVASLYRHPKISAFVTLTRGEGFGLPVLEAAASGLPVIATNWSAHTEFLRQGKFIKVDYSVAPIHESRIDNQIFMKGAQWATPIEEDVKRKLRKFVESPSVPKQWAKELATSLKKSHSFDAVKAQYTQVFKEIL